MMEQRHLVLSLFGSSVSQCSVDLHSPPNALINIGVVLPKQFQSIPKRLLVVFQRTTITAGVKIKIANAQHNSGGVLGLWAQSILEPAEGLEVLPVCLLDLAKPHHGIAQHLLAEAHVDVIPTKDLGPFLQTRQEARLGVEIVLLHEVRDARPKFPRRLIPVLDATRRRCFSPAAGRRIRCIVATHRAAGPEIPQPAKIFRQALILVQLVRRRLLRDDVSPICRPSRRSPYCGLRSCSSCLQVDGMALIPNEGNLGHELPGRDVHGITVSQCRTHRWGRGGGIGAGMFTPPLVRPRNAPAPGAHRW
mmetsp:Transcript_48513/g.146339  ORF Transcript_48513/g.146339 Transcript_48513/m.146339 type:complete len:306 (-) Transcript_48513:1356-2273(-)